MQADNIEKIRNKLQSCLNHNPDVVDAQGLAVMGIALLVDKFKGSNIFQDVYAFHKKMGIEPQKERGLGYKGLSKKELTFRMTLLKEEYTEYITACSEGDCIGQLDALLDIIYICVGSIYKAGWDGEEGWRRIHNSNMAKEPSTKATKRSGDTGEVDVVKPKQWKPPVLNDLV